ncbi:hypothetical protein GCM10027064_03470 [Microbacterium petrolearium]
MASGVSVLSDPARPVPESFGGVGAGDYACRVNVGVYIDGFNLYYGASGQFAPV